MTSRGKSVSAHQPNDATLAVALKQSPPFFIGLGVGTVQKIKNEMLKPEMAAAA